MKFECKQNKRVIQFPNTQPRDLTNVGKRPEHGYVICPCSLYNRKIRQAVGEVLPGTSKSGKKHLHIFKMYLIIIS